MQAFPQAPQLETLLAVSTSQPSAAERSQSANVPMHEEMRHVPVAHVAFEFARLHWTPHEPQLERVFRLVSQPSTYFALQSS